MYSNKYYTKSNMLAQTSDNHILNPYTDCQISSKQNVNSNPRNILINPNFAKQKIFINPEFCKTQNMLPTSVHINPRSRKNSGQKLHSKENERLVNIPLKNTQIHINPKMGKGTNFVTPKTLHINPNFNNCKLNQEQRKGAVNKPQNGLIVLSKTKLIRNPVIPQAGNPKKTPSKQSIVDRSVSRFKIDRTRRKSFNSNGTIKSKAKYVFGNRFITISDLSKTVVVKKSNPNLSKSTNLVNISGIMYKNSKTSLKRTTITPKKLLSTNMQKKSSANNSKNLSLVNISGIMYKKSKNSLKRASTSVKRNSVKIHITKHKLVKKCLGKVGETISPKIKKANNARCIISGKSLSKRKNMMKISPKKLKKCNLPCSIYRKYGTCPGKENGKCFKKHDPDQIALCTKFLQGACLKMNCPLSHNVSEEKMPTCKFFLEGCCMKDNCPYLHVKLNPRTEICRDFIEGFCKKAAKCDKRHQYLCPDYEKYGNCPKQRCSYPHGKMVRPYLINKTNFAKNYSTKAKITELVQSSKDANTVVQISNQSENPKDRPRYYVDTNISNEKEQSIKDVENDQLISTNKLSSTIGLLNRPKLGVLPSFIPFDNSLTRNE